MKLYLFIISLTFLMAGCGSVNQPIASVELVQSNNTLEYNKAESAMVDLLNQSSIKFEAMQNGQPVIIHPLFFSASGNDCRYVESGNIKNLYCSIQNGQWRLIQPVLAGSGFVTTEALQ